jgi:hypothetical protein
LQIGVSVLRLFVAGCIFSQPLTAVLTSNSGYKASYRIPQNTECQFLDTYPGKISHKIRCDFHEAAQNFSILTVTHKLKKNKYLLIIKQTLTISRSFGGRNSQNFDANLLGCQTITVRVSGKLRFYE